MSFANDDAETGRGPLRPLPAAWSRPPSPRAPAGASREQPAERRPAWERRARNHPSWQSRIGDPVSSGGREEIAGNGSGHGERVRRRVAFDAFRTQCRDELRPVLEKSAAMLEEWGLHSHVIESLRHRSTHVPRTFELGLQIHQFGARGPGTLTLHASETHEHVRIKIAVGPPSASREVREHVGSARPDDLSGGMMGGLVATLVERIFSG
jgi:hypothetical protein